jgi:RNA polymerase sigma-70 factor, ECF subfamily
MVVSATERRSSTEEEKQSTISAMTEHLPFLRRYARSMTRTAADGDDLVQNTLLRAVCKVDQFQPGTNLRAWLVAILRNVFVDSYRRKRPTTDWTTAQSVMSAGLFAPASQIASLEMIDLRDAIAALPYVQQSTLMLIAVEDMSYEEVATIMNVPVGTVRSRLSRARAALLQGIGGTYKNETAAQTRLILPTSKAGPRREHKIAIAKEKAILAKVNSRIARAETLMAEQRQRIVDLSRNGFDTARAYKLFNTMTSLLKTLMETREQALARLEKLNRS